jgi:hypothetical protein
MKISKLITRSGKWGYANALAVEAEIDGEQDDLLERLCRAVTRWVNSTPDGAKAWEYSSQDFNIGDLASELGDPILLMRMADEGIRGFVLSDVPEEDRYWRYDTVLVNVADLEEEQ